MNQLDFDQLLYEIRSQLNRNGLPVEFNWNSHEISRPDMDAIRLTIEREEKIYSMLTVA